MSIYYKYAPGGSKIVVLYYVDDCVYLYTNEDLGKWFVDTLDTATVKVSNKFYQTTLPADMIFTKEVVSTSDEQVEKLTSEYKIHYRACIGSLIYLFSTRVDLRFALHKLEKFSANPGKVHFEVLVHSAFSRPPVSRLLLGINKPFSIIFIFIQIDTIINIR